MFLKLPYFLPLKIKNGLPIACTNGDVTTQIFSFGLGNGLDNEIWVLLLYEDTQYKNFHDVWKLFLAIQLHFLGEHIVMYLCGLFLLSE